MRIGINGFGRIGRACFRINHIQKHNDIVCINDINPDPNNVAYLLKYDSTYGVFDGNVHYENSNLIVDEQKIHLYNKKNITDVPWEEHDVDIVIDSTGIRANLVAASPLRKRGIRKVVVTNSPHTDLPLRYVVMGVNEKTVHPEDFLISSSICDANAFVPVMALLQKNLGVEYGFVTTLHPWLNYQNLLDGPSMSVSDPGSIHSMYVLGRASTNALIPKTTTVLQASQKILPWLNENFMCMSYRTPTNIVSCADVSVKLHTHATVKDIVALFEETEQKQELPIIHNSREALISQDFLKSPFSVNVDHRWIMISGKSYLKLVLWYDNEWGYSNRVLDLARYLGSL